MRTSTVWLAATAAFVAAVALTDPAEAQGVRAVCHVQALCPGVQPGGGRIIQCLRAHKDELSERCLVALGRMFLNMGHRRGSPNGPGNEAYPGPGGPPSYGPSNGPAPNGPPPNGPSPYDSSPNGPPPNGPSSYGPSPNGPSPNGPPGPGPGGPDMGDDPNQ